MNFFQNQLKILDEEKKNVFSCRKIEIKNVINMKEKVLVRLNSDNIFFYDFFESHIKGMK